MKLPCCTAVVDQNREISRDLESFYMCQHDSGKMHLKEKVEENETEKKKGDHQCLLVLTNKKTHFF